jgi:hypothetical protein
MYGVEQKLHVKELFANIQVAQFNGQLMQDDKLRVVPDGQFATHALLIRTLVEFEQEMHS